MATINELDTQITAAIEALPNTAARLLSDYLDEAGEVLPRDAYRYRLRLDATEKLVIGSNRYDQIVRASGEILVRMAAVPPLPPAERAGYRDALWGYQQSVVTLSFWDGLAAVKEVPPDTTPQVTEEIQRVGDVLWFQYQVDLVLA